MADIKLFRSERLTDNPDGGGLATSTVVVDGEVNNVFDDISRIDRVNGDLSLRKVFALADGANTDLYSGLHAIVAAPPLDPRVSAVIFRTRRTGSTQYAWGDERADAQAAVERYLDESVITRMVPYDRQLEGQLTVLVYQRPELALPEIGEVYALKDEAAGATEFVRVADIDHQVETFTDINGDYRVRVITLTITQPLSREFPGSQPNRFFNVDTNKSVLRRTIASDAARYKGVVRLAEDANVGDLTIKVESVFAQLVPAASSEVGVTDASPAGAEAVLEASEEEYGTPPASMDLVAASGIQLPVAAAFPVRLQWSTGGVYQEQEDGTFLYVSGAPEPGSYRVAPDRMSVIFTGANSGTRTVRAFYRPAVVLGRSGFSWQVPVQIQNRGYVYVGTLRPPPEPGSTAIQFRALGRWYTLQDDGTGALVGDSGAGTGLVNFTTGSFNVSLGALPDVGSSVLANWAGSSEFEIRAGDVEIAVPAVRLTLDAGNCEPGSLGLAWESGGVPKAATDDGNGNLTGDGTGRVIYSTGEIVLYPTLLPDSASTLTATYDAGTTTEELFTPSKTGSDLVLLLAGAPLREGSLQVQYSAFAEDFAGNHAQVVRTIRDNGAGGLVDENGPVLGGSINYSSGALVVPADFVANMAQSVRSAFGQPLPSRTSDPITGYLSPLIRVQPWRIGTTRGDIAANFVNGTAVTVRYKADSTIDEALEEEYDLPPLQVDLTPRVRSQLVPRSLLFQLGTRTYYERGGTLYYGMSAVTGAGTSAGSIDYSTGVATLTSWEGGVAPAFNVLSLLTEVAPVPLAVVHGRTPGSPLRPGTFYIQANRPDGTLVSGTADNNGVVTGPGVNGYVDVVTGVFGVGFGEYVLDSSLSPEEKAEPWYDAGSVDADGYVWRPAEILPGTVTFNCVVVTAAALDPEIIGVNPVRLPMDGRVPVLRRGDTLVISDPQPYELPDALEADQVVVLPRGNLASVALYDQDGLGVDPALYTLDRAAGELMMASPLDLSDYAEPLVAIHSIEDMALCLDAQITGEVSLGQALTNDYTAGNSLVSSAQVIGDVQARYQGLFAQNTWTGVWSDELIGAPPTSGAQYNDGTFPLEVLNRDTITQRWRLHFTSSTAFNVVGEELGVVATGNTTDGAAPINPATGQPYFEILGAGFGSGWATGNNIRFNTYAAGGPIWIARTVISGPATEQDDRIRIETRWDKD